MKVVLLNVDFFFCLLLSLLQNLLWYFQLLTINMNDFHSVYNFKNNTSYNFKSIFPFYLFLDLVGLRKNMLENISLI